LYHDQVRDDPGSLLKEAFEFLGVSVSFVPEDISRIVGKSYIPKIRYIEACKRRINSILARYQMYRVIDCIKKTGIIDLYKRLNAGEVDDSLVGGLVNERIPLILDDLGLLLDSDLPIDREIVMTWRREITSLMTTA
jgi:hypothetical protein